MNYRPSTGRFIAAIILGLILGGILGEFLGFLLGWIGEVTGAGADNNLRILFVHPFDLDLGFADPAGFKLDLYMIKIRLGVGFRFNLASIIGMIGAIYVEKWSRNH